MMIVDYTSLGIEISNEEIKECLQENDSYYGWMGNSFGCFEFAYTYVRQLGLSDDKSTSFATIISYFFEDEDPMEEYDEKLYSELRDKFEELEPHEFFYYVAETFLK